jgi:hypothetical protein
VSAINDGGPAFPCPVEFDPNGQLVSHGSFGMTLRDWFAGQIILGVFADPSVRGVTEEQAELLAKKSFMVADKMLKAREVNHD